ncbi:MAG: metal-dependent hydrolase [Limnochordia bacterium]|nr:metal-dependent hydrolase [Limnochordia bacterium]
MLLFAHTGITAGCAWLAGKTVSILNRDEPGPVKTGDGEKSASASASSRVNKPFHVSGIDYRMLLIGSMLPDIIDKPLGIYLLADEIGNGRIYGHTLLFLLFTVTAGILLYYFRGSPALLLISAGTFAHLVLDQMWQNPSTLFWPILGAEFERHETGEWLGGLFETLTSNPSVYIPEIIGVLIVAVFAWQIIRNGRILAFIRTGRII